MPIVHLSDTDISPKKFSHIKDQVSIVITIQEAFPLLALIF